MKINFKDKELKEIEQTVAEVEQSTSAEIKVIIINYCWGNLLNKAKCLFEEHELHKTKERNAVMLLLVLKNRQLLIYGDKGINDKVEPDFWVGTKDKMINQFKSANYLAGLKEGVVDIGEKLKLFFPANLNDVNEINNEVVYEAD